MELVLRDLEVQLVSARDLDRWNAQGRLVER